MTLPRPEEKERIIQEMFTSVAPRYDLNNTLLSMGFHHRWKEIAVQTLGVGLENRILDLCTGTGDLAILLSRKVGKRGKVVALDLNKRMLEFGTRKMKEQGAIGLIDFLQASAEVLPFSDNAFDGVSVAFGIRNVSGMEELLRETYRVLRPRGKMVCLEFSYPKNPILRKAYDFYSFSWLPWIATLISSDKTGTYQYLPASIRNFPNQESFKRMMTDVGFRGVRYQNLTGGIVAIHTGFKHGS